MDTGASSSVCSMEMVSRLFPQCVKSLCPSKKTFKFGDSRSFLSMVVIFVSSTIPLLDSCQTVVSQCVTLKFDVANAQIPCSLSRSALFKLNDTIDFNTHRLNILKKGSIAFGESAA